jgi:hypothetical protein
VIDSGVDVGRGTSLRLVAGLTVGVAVLSGCSEGPRAAETLPSVAAPAATEEELPPLGPEDFPMPDEARTQDAAGAEAFVRYYIGLINRTSTVMDAAPLRELSDGCVDCDRIAEATEEAAAAGQDYEGGEMTVIGFGRPLRTDLSVEIPLRVNQARFTVRNPDGSEGEGGLAAYTDVLGSAAATWNEDQRTWLMTGLTFG